MFSTQHGVNGSKPLQHGVNGSKPLEISKRPALRGLERRGLTTSAAQAATTTERETKMKKTNKIGRSAEIFIAEEEF